MLRNRLYYALKPFLPASLRLSVRRWFALRKRGRVGAVWPTLPGSERPPEGWPGWPDGKQFALVLTHDVESQAGLDQCRQLMRLEMDLGFRSSFNFIPEGDYTVPAGLIQELKQNGFEVGVHDLNHDGKLYRSRAEFMTKAARINCHLRNWGAVGFRSGFMLRQLDWLHELDVQYDASTFDTDPFEPQPDGAGTIFPFCVPNPHRENARLDPDLDPEVQNSSAAIRPEFVNRKSNRGYVELPYTLAQDSTLFLLLQESTIDVWKRKLDWIAEHGGMAMLNVHPDYIDFSGAGQPGVSYPIRLYAEFLNELKQRWAGGYWQALPREVAEMAKGALASKPGGSPCVPSTVESDGKKKRSGSTWITRLTFPSLNPS